MTCLDVLSYMDTLHICTGYEYEGKVYTDFLTTDKLYKAKPVYETLPGWKCDIRDIKNYDELPKEAKAYVEFIEKQLGVKIFTSSFSGNFSENAARQFRYDFSGK